MLQLTPHTSFFGAVALVLIIATFFVVHPAMMIFATLVELTAFASSMYDYSQDRRTVNIINGLLWFGCALFQFLSFMCAYIV